MFKQYHDLCDVISVLLYCPNDKTILVNKENSGEFWIPCSKVERNSWKATASKIVYEIIGTDAVAQSQHFNCVPLRMFKTWLPNHQLACVYHTVYKLAIKSDAKKRIKGAKSGTGTRTKLQWVNMVELERQRVHGMLRSPELVEYATLTLGEPVEGGLETDGGVLVETNEENVILGGNLLGGGGALVLSRNYQLLQAANYTKDDQSRVYKEYLLKVYPANLMGLYAFTQFMTEFGWQRAECPSLYRAADVTGRGGLTFLEFLLWTAALEPQTQHNGIAAELRCLYIFRYYDTNRDQKLEYVEFKELIAAARGLRQMPVDALSVSRDADTCLRLMGLQPNTQLSLADFMKAIAELRIRGSSSLLRSQRSIIRYLNDLHDRDELTSSSTQLKNGIVQHRDASSAPAPDGASLRDGSVDQARRPKPDYSVAVYSVRLHRTAQNEMLELSEFDDDAVSPSTAQLVSGPLAAQSMSVLGPSACPVEVMTAVRYFASPMDRATSVRSTSKLQQEKKRASLSANMQMKPAFAWASQVEEAALGQQLLKLCEAVRPLLAKESRLVRLSSPVYAIGDLHGNLAALLAMESALWPSGPALTPARILFLGDFVDRGAHGTELMAYLLSAKLQRPSGVLLIRGNHECRDIQKMFTFYHECLAKYGEVEGTKVWNALNQVFDVLPLAAVVDDKIFCCHGGIPPPWVCPLISAIDKVPVPLVRPGEQSTIAWELLWNDPVRANRLTASLALELSSNEGFAVNGKRGTGHVFDQSALDRFLAANQLSHVVRAHELHQQGFMCQLRGKLVSVFSSSHYCGGTNDCGIALLDRGKLRLIRINADY